MHAKKRLAEYFLVSRLAKDPVRRTAEYEADPEFTAATEQQEEDSTGRREKGKKKRSRRPSLFAASRAEGDDNPIIDICVIFPNQKEKIPAGYTCLVRTPFGHRGDCNSGVVGGEGVFICVKHALPSKTRKVFDPAKVSVIVDVQVIFVEKEPVPDGYELIKTSRTGVMPANLNYGYLGQAIHLAVKRVPLSQVSGEERYHSIRPIVDMCIINASKNETVPHGFECLNKSTSDGNWTGSKMYLCIRRAQGFGMLDMPFAACLADRVPREDRPNLELSNEIALFTAPEGMRLVRRETTNVPLPHFFTFVLTRDDGSQVHGSCFTFYEKLDDATAEFLESSYDAYLSVMRESTSPVVRRQIVASSLAGRCKIEEDTDGSRVRFYSFDSCGTLVESDVETEEDSESQSGQREGGTPRSDAPMQRYASGKSFTSATSSVFSGPREFKIYAPVSICILSRFPFYREFKRFLMLLYQVSISKTVLPIESFVGQLVFELPVPRPGAAGIEVRFGSGDHNIRFSLPSDSGLPICSVNYETVFKCLGPKEVAQLLTLMLLEKRIILHSRYLSVLNQVAESIRVLMFPFNWQHIFIPVCPGNLAHIIDAPMPYLIGLHSDVMGSVPLPADTWEVALDEGKIFYLDVLERATSISVSLLLQTPPGGSAIDPLHVVRTAKPPPTLPTAILNNFVKSLNATVSALAPTLEVDLGKGGSKSFGLQSPDMAYAMTPLEASGEGALKALQYAVRDAAIQVLVELIGNYRDFLLPPKLALQGLSQPEVTPTNLPNIFNLNGFLASLNKANRPFVTELTKSLHFTKFVDERTFSTLLSYKFMFFDAVTTEFFARQNGSHTSSQDLQSTNGYSSLKDLKGAGGLRNTSSFSGKVGNLDAEVGSPGDSFSNKTLKRPSSFALKNLRSPAGLFSSPAKSRSTGRSASSKKIGAKRSSSGQSLLVEKVLASLESVSLNAEADQVETFQGGGGEEHFQHLRQTQQRSMQLLLHRGGPQSGDSPWKEYYTYENFPCLDDVLLMSFQSGDLANDSASMQSAGRSPKEEGQGSFSYSPRLRGRQRASSTPMMPLTRTLSISSGLSSVHSGLFSPSSHRSKNIWDDESEKGTKTGDKVQSFKSHGSAASVPVPVSTSVSFPSQSIRALEKGVGAKSRSEGSWEIESGHPTMDRLDETQEIHSLGKTPGGAEGSGQSGKGIKSRYHSVSGWMGGLHAVDTRSRASTLSSFESPSHKSSNSPPSMLAPSLSQPSKSKGSLARTESSSIRFALAGIRMAEEINHARLELQFAFSEVSTGMPRAKSCLVEVLGAWSDLLPALLSLESEGRTLTLSLALADVFRLSRESGYVLDEAASRAVLAGCSYGGPAFAPDANWIFHSLVSNGTRPNAVTYGFFTQALAVRRHALQPGPHQKRMSQRIWKRLKIFLWAQARFRAAGRGGLLPLPRLDVLKEDTMLLSLWCGTKCPNCKSRLLDEHIMQGWIVDDAQLAQDCPFCDFLVVPRLNFVLGCLRPSLDGEEAGGEKFEEMEHGQCEYMSPLVLRRAVEVMLEEGTVQADFRLTEDAVKEKNVAVYYNLLWYTERLGLASLFDQGDVKDKAKKIVICTWQPVCRDVKLLRILAEEKADAESRTVGGADVNKVRSKASKGLKKKYATASRIDVDASMYVVQGLKPFETFEPCTLWGNPTIRQLLQDEDLAKVRIPETYYVTSDSTPINVVRKLVYYLEESRLVSAVRLFLSARMASRNDEEADCENGDCVEYDSCFVLRGWEVFSNSVYIELFALSQMSMRAAEQSEPMELDLERSLAKVLRDMDKVDPTLASYVTTQDFPPNMLALAFRTYFPHLYP